MLDHLPRALVIAVIAVVLFGSLVGARYIFVPSARGALSAGYAYDKLGLALAQLGVGPAAPAEQLQREFIKYAENPTRVQRTVDGDGAAILAVSSVAVCQLAGDAVSGLTLYPQEWRKLRGGALRAALLDISRLPLERQAGADKGDGGLPVIQENFEFAVTAGGQSYTFIPHFTGRACTDIQVRFGVPAPPAAAAAGATGSGGLPSAGDPGDAPRHGLNPESALDAI